MSPGHIITKDAFLNLDPSHEIECNSGLMGFSRNAIDTHAAVHILVFLAHVIFH